MSNREAYEFGVKLAAVDAGLMGMEKTAINLGALLRSPAAKGALVGTGVGGAGGAIAGGDVESALLGAALGGAGGAGLGKLRSVLREKDLMRMASNWRGPARSARSRGYSEGGGGYGGGFLDLGNPMR